MKLPNHITLLQAKIKSMVHRLVCLYDNDIGEITNLYIYEFIFKFIYQYQYLILCAHLWYVCVLLYPQLM